MSNALDFEDKQGIQIIVLELLLCYVMLCYVMARGHMFVSFLFTVCEHHRRRSETGFRQLRS